jgi:prepilin-type N-terminal cleavage/methylation domain-containing protein
VKDLIIKIGRASHKRVKGEKGFTLIELIVVIAVLGVLATLVVPKVAHIKDDAEDTINDANKKIIINALERYYAENMEYPTDDTDNKLPKDKLKDYLDLNDDEIAKWKYERTGKDSYNLTSTAEPSS